MNRSEFLRNSFLAALSVAFGVETKKEFDFSKVEVHKYHLPGFYEYAKELSIKLS